MTVLPLHDVRQRQQLIRDRLRAIGLQIPLPCDVMFEGGELHEQAWRDLHDFRFDQVQLCATQLVGRVRRVRSGNANGGFRMPNFGLLRAEICRDRMDPHCYEVAMVLVGLMTGEVERMEAVNAAWQVGQIYRGNAGAERWRD